MPLSVGRLGVIVAHRNPLLGRALETLLARIGCRVRTASDGFGVLALVKEWRPDVVVVDADMPRLDGLRTCALLKADERSAMAKVVILSGCASPWERTRARLAGVDTFISTPFSGLELIDAMVHATAPS